ncbi:hypothetical protein, partial [Actinomadura yumaensis]
MDPRERLDGTATPRTPARRRPSGGETAATRRRVCGGPAAAARRRPSDGETATAARPWRPGGET